MLCTHTKRTIRMKNFDIAIIGGGPAGYNAAANASANGLQVVLFEHTALGGVCLNEGCYLRRPYSTRPTSSTKCAKARLMVSM